MDDKGCAQLLQEHGALYRRCVHLTDQVHVT